jgi:hypothetical protein
LGRLRLAQDQPAALALTTEAVERLERIQGRAYVFETPDMWMCHSEALAAAGRASEARHYLELAYRAIEAFEAQMTNAETRRRFRSLYLMDRIITAMEQGQIRPFPH